jgi:hypothetical protein
MKNKLRKISIENLDYLYSVTERHHLGSEGNTLTVKVFLSGHKLTPLTIDFLSFGYYYCPGHDYTKNPLISGISLTNRKTNSADNVNINEPKYIRELILQGRKNGWTGTNKIEKQNGLNYLTELGYETNILSPIAKNNM